MIPSILARFRALGISYNINKNISLIEKKIKKRK
jgi:hypothetical protein